MWSKAPDPYLTAMIESGAVVQDFLIKEDRMIVGSKDVEDAFRKLSQVDM